MVLAAGSLWVAFITLHALEKGANDLHMKGLFASPVAIAVVMICFGMIRMMRGNTDRLFVLRRIIQREMGAGRDIIGLSRRFSFRGQAEVEKECLLAITNSKSSVFRRGGSRGEGEFSERRRSQEQLRKSISPIA